MAFEKICDARHIDFECVVCEDDNPEDLIIEKIDNNDTKKIKKHTHKTKYMTRY